MIILATADGKIFARWQRGVETQAEIVPVNSLASLHRALDLHPEVTVLLHSVLPGLSGLPEIQLLITRYPQANLFVLADIPEEQQGIELIRAGVLGYANTHIRPDILQEAVKVIELGEIWASKRLLQWMVHHCGTPEQFKQTLGSYIALDSLTPGEKKVVEHLLKGDTNKQIARKLQITERTVKAHLTTIYRKTGVKDRLHLALLVNNYSTQ